MIEQAILHTDGGSRGNPGPSGIGFVITVDQGNGLVTLTEGGAYIGEATNNLAEYQALLWGLANALALDIRHLDIRADSELMIKQVKGEYKVRNEGIKPLFDQVMRALEGFDSYHLAHVYREENERADTLANEAMDVQAAVGTFEVACEASQSDAVAMGDSVEEPVVPAPEAPEVQQSPQELSFFDELQMSALENNEQEVEAAVSEQSPHTTQTEGIYSLTVKSHFDAAHALVGYPGECRQLHGHTWDIEATVSGTTLDEVGIVYDFKALKTDLASILDDYDHLYLNEVPPFDTLNATAENLARVIYERLEESLPSHITLDEIAVWESPIAKLTYRRS